MAEADPCEIRWADMGTEATRAVNRQAVEAGSMPPSPRFTPRPIRSGQAQDRLARSSPTPALDRLKKPTLTPIPSCVHDAALSFGDKRKKPRRARTVFAETTTHVVELKGGIVGIHQTLTPVSHVSRVEEIRIGN